MDDALSTQFCFAFTQTGDIGWKLRGALHGQSLTSTMPVMSRLLTDHEITERVLAHIANRTTDVGEALWREPVENYRSQERFAAEVDRVLRRAYTAFCPASALPEPGSYIAREAAGRPVVAVRGQDGVVRAFLNVCRHRGMRIAHEQGCVKAFVCPYHGWTYELNGRLRHVPHAEGFPGLDKESHGLAPIDAVESHGLVFVSQTKDAALADVAGLPELIGEGQRLYSTSARDTQANWKIVLEGFLEGYHIRATHPETFYPYGFDNLNVIEQTGRHSRVTFPFRRIEKLAAVPADERRVLGFVTFVYHIFPNALVTVLSNHTNLLVLEPLAVDHTRVVSYSLTNHSGDAAEALEAATRDAHFTAIGADEDRAVVSAIQRGVASDANDSFVFGHFESAIVHFHRTLDATLAGS
jgi:phenylpropionate dioxygenase-like ring-hydroxylating dioxygenase large terminal subunit